ncbi:MAG: DUF3662 domain-containing protein [Fimbriimonadaceae bacterium]|nr:DUF3662 domain-containing protein [Fimbriimonadaceae bacterium]
MGWLARLEQAVGGSLEGLSRKLCGGRLTVRAIAAAVESGLQPVPHDGQRTLPNALRLELHPSDLERLASQLGEVRRQVAQRLAELATRHGLPLVGRPAVVLEPSETVTAGEVRLLATVCPGPGAAELATADGSVQLALRGASAVIGREPGCDLVLLADGVSRRHARVEPRADHYVIVDLGSTNGTQVNGARVALHELRHGSVVSIGTVRLQFREL